MATVVSCVHDPERDMTLSRMIKAGAYNSIGRFIDRDQAASWIEIFVDLGKDKAIVGLALKNLTETLALIPMISGFEDEGSHLQSLLWEHRTNSEGKGS